MICKTHGTYADEEGCGDCEAMALAEAATYVFAMRGRWMVVYQNGGFRNIGADVTRHRRKSSARAEVRRAIEVIGGGAAVLRRFRSDLVVRDESLPGWRIA